MKKIEGKNGGTLKSMEKGDPTINPNGRPLGRQNASTIIRKWLEAKEKAKNPITGKEEIMTQLDIGTLAQIVKMRKGDTTSFSALLDRSDGKPKQFTELSGNPDQPVVPGAIDYDKLPTETLQAIIDARIKQGE